MQIKSLDGTYEIAIKETTPPSKQKLDQFDHLKNLPFISLDAKVECLLGSAHIASFFVGEPLLSRKNEPIGLKTNFSWTMAGNGGSDPAPVAFFLTKEKELKDQLEMLFLNNFPVIKDDKK